jgi:NADH-quinone oxidoreductase subunit M
MILPWLILIPFIGGLLCWLGERFGATLPRWIALLTMSLNSASACGCGPTATIHLPRRRRRSDWALEFKFEWIQRFGISVHLALDGLSLLMILLTGLLGVLSVLCSWKEIQRHVGFFHLNLMWILGGVVGVFLALDLFLFFFFWEMMLVPMYFLIALWGHSSSDGKKTRIYAATKFFIFTQASGLIMLVAILGLVLVNFNTTGVLTFNYATC